jgi:hypothetical protein
MSVVTVRIESTVVNGTTVAEFAAYVSWRCAGMNTLAFVVTAARIVAPPVRNGSGSNTRAVGLATRRFGFGGVSREKPSNRYVVEHPRNR